MHLSHSSNQKKSTGVSTVGPRLIGSIGTEAFRAAAPKGIRLSIRPSFRPSVPPVGHQGLQFALSALNLAIQASNQPSKLQIRPPNTNLTSRFQIGPSDLQLALQTSNSPPRLKFALQTSNLLSKP